MQSKISLQNNGYVVMMVLTLLVYNLQYFSLIRWHLVMLCIYIHFIYVCTYVYFLIGHWMHGASVPHSITGEPSSHFTF